SSTLGNAPTGQAWVTEAGSPGVNANTWYPTTTSNTKATLNAGIADGLIAGKLTINPTAAATNAYLIFRGIDVNNVLFAYIAEATNTISLYKFDAGASVLLAPSAPYAFVPGKAYVISAAVAATRITIAV